MKTSTRNSLLFFATSAACLFIGCQQTDLFDAVYTKKMYEETFPVKNVAEDMDWKTTSKASVSITVAEDYDVLYKIQVYDNNPLDSAVSAKLLTSGYAKTNLTFETEIDYPTALDTVFVCRIDPVYRKVVKMVPITDGKIEAVFGESSTPSARSIAATDGAIPTKNALYTEAQIQSMLNSASTYEYQANTALDQTGKSIYGNSSANGRVIKLTRDYSGKIYSNGIYGKVTFIVAAKWTYNVDCTFNEGTELIIAKGGEIVSPTNKIQFYDASDLLVMPGGKISAKQLNISDGVDFYNGGTVNLDNLNNLASTLYNANDASISISNALDGKNTLFSDHTFINHGTITAKQVTGSPIIENGCQLTVTSTLNISYLSLGASSSVITRDLNTYSYSDIYLAENSILSITRNATFSSSTITGPTTGYALFKINKIYRVYGIGRMYNNIYVELNYSNNYSKLWTMIFYGNGRASVSNFGESPLYIPADNHCSGGGNTPTGYVPPVIPTAITYTYAYEDNFPKMGDYDFNDVLLDVSSDEIRNTDNNITAITLHVKLSAAGASKTLGCGLRLVGIDKSDISSVTFGGADLTDFQNTLTGVMFHETTGGFESNNSDLVIPVFGDVHKVLSPNTEKKLYNTLIDVNQQKLYVVPSKTMDITINFSTPEATSLIQKENMDFFITYNTIAKIPSKRTEIHLYEFRDLQSGVGLDMSQVLSVAGNYTWAICVPEFRYPIEAIKVTDAYSLFASWAQALKDQRGAYEDWYKTVDTDKVYR